MVEHHPVTVAGAGSNPVAVADPSPCGETDIMPDYESGVAGSNPAGDAKRKRCKAQTSKAQQPARLA